MNIALYSKGILGQKVYDYLKSAEGLDVVCGCVDNAPYGNDGVLVFSEPLPLSTGFATISVNELSAKYSAGEVDAVIVATDNEVLDYVVRRLTGAGIENIAILPSYYAEDYDIMDDSFMWVETDKPRMPYVEYHISFQCNLKCSGCTHFSNIVDTDRFGDYESFCRDLMRLQELFWGIGKIRLMGGEPLLNPQLPDFIYAARAAFPDADIRVVSNGLLLREDHTAVLDAMRDTATYFDVSMYPPTTAQIERIADICNRHCVKLTVTPEIKEFTAGMNTHGHTDPARSHAVCPAAHCAYLCEGRISTCAMPQLIEIYNDRYGLNITSEASDIINLYEGGLDGYELLRRLKSPMDICRFCDERRRSYEWFVSREPAMNEWIGAI